MITLADQDQVHELRQGLGHVKVLQRALVRAARAHALLNARSYATPHDVKAVARDVLRHRVVVSYEAEADGVTPDSVIEAVLAAVETP